MILTTAAICATAGFAPTPDPDAVFRASGPHPVFAAPDRSAQVLTHLVTGQALRVTCEHAEWIQITARMGAEVVTGFTRIDSTNFGAAR